MKYGISHITVVVCNWMQSRFTIGAVRNIRHYYPGISVVVVDDGSDASKIKDFDIAYARLAYSKDERLDNNPVSLIGAASDLDFTLVDTRQHVGHGSALDYGFDKATTPLVLTMDNDIRVLQGGLVEQYLEKLNEDPDNIYAVGTTYQEASLKAQWIDPWFSLYQVKPIRDLHLTFSNFIFPAPQKTFHIGTGAFLHTMLTSEALHRPKQWRAVYYPEPEQIHELWHLKKFPTDTPGNQRYDMWERWIDGVPRG